MNLATGVAVFEALEKDRFAENNPGDEPFVCPVYDVRLIADTTRESMERSYMVRVTPGGAMGGTFDRDNWLYVLELAGEHELDVDLQNAGMELR